MNEKLEKEILASSLEVTQRNNHNNYAAKLSKPMTFDELIALRSAIATHWLEHQLTKDQYDNLISMSKSVELIP